MKKIFTLLVLALSLSVSGQTSIEIAKKAIKSTVSIIALDKSMQPLGSGSGFLIDDETIVTNVHVIAGCNSAYVLTNGEEKKYKVAGYLAIDKANDLVILKVSGLSGSKLPLGSEVEPEIGEKIYAIGNPKGFNGTFSEGIVSGIRKYQTNNVLQITAPISPGSSGGAVLNSTAYVVGIAFASFTDGQNLNFAIPVKYLIALKKTISDEKELSTILPAIKPKTNTTVSPNINEGVTIRNIQIKSNGSLDINFSIKNNLQYSVCDIRVLFLAYDKTGTVVDYKEVTYFEFSEEVAKLDKVRNLYYDPSTYETNYKYLQKEYVLKANLAKQKHINLDYDNLVSSVKARILDFRILEE